MAEAFNRDSMIRSRGNVYNKTTGRWLGLESNFDGETSGMETLDDMNMTDLRARAKELGMSGYSGLNKDDLVAEVAAVESAGGTTEVVDGASEATSESVDTA